MKSLKELFRTGRGPSSSHTMGPARAAEQILREFPDAESFEVTLFGSLAATGKGHFTDRAILEVLNPKRTRILWAPETVLPEHPNGMKFRIVPHAGPAAERTLFSIGGGAVSADGTAETTPEVYPFRDMRHIMEHCLKESIPLWSLAEVCEGKEIWDFLDSVLDTMMKAVDRGLAAEGVLPGGLRLMRKARNIHLKTELLRNEIRRTGLLASFAYAVCEENASLGIVVTAPTCGSCGVLPAVLKYALDRGVTRPELLHALACAGIVGNVVKQNASISGAEVGCQGEVGTACAMASAAWARLIGAEIRQIEYAAEIGLEHFLGLTCDPILGLVQIPCIERNALAANRAAVAAEMAILSDGHHLVSFDAVVKTMLETGHDLPSLYRETSAGGLSRYGVSETGENR